MSTVFFAGVIIPIMLVILLAMGIPVAFALMVTGILGLVVIGTLQQALAAMWSITYSAVASWLLTCVPLFILMGHLAFVSGLADKAYYAAYRWIGQVRAGLGMASAVACGIFAATTGSSVATAATVGKIAIPEMEKYGYDSGFACGAVAAGGTLGILIPPSIILVIYGVITEESIGKLLVAGFLPGLLSIASYSAMMWITARIRPHIAPPGPSVSWKERLNSLGMIWGVLLLLFVVMGGIYFGVATPTEAAALGAFGALLLALPNIRRDRKLLTDALLETTLTTSMVFAILAGAALLTLLVVYAGVPFYITEAVLALEAPRVVVLILLLLLYIPLGMILDGMSIVVITIPLMYPVVTALGYDGIWFGIIVVKMIEMGLMTPPLGINVFVIRGIAPHVPIESIFANIVRFVVADLIVVAILIAFPQIALFLPNAMWT